MKRVDGKALSRAKEQAVLPRQKLCIAEAAQPAHVLRLARQDGRHGKAFALRREERLRQIQVAAALRHRGHPPLYRPGDRRAHGDVFRKPRGMQLRIAARQVQAADVLRQGRIVQGAEKDRLGTEGREGLQRLGIAEAEGLVPGHGDAAARRFGGRERFRFRRRAVKERQQARQVCVLLQRAGELGDPPVQIRNLLRGQKAEMAALDPRLVELRQAAEDRQARLPFQHGRKGPAQRGRTFVEQHARNAAVRPEVPQAPQLGREGQAGPADRQHQQHGQRQRHGKLPGAGAGADAAEPVIKAHGPLDHRRPVTPAGPGKQGPDLAVVPQEKVEVVALDPQHRPVKHGVDVVRAAFEGTGGEAALAEHAQQGTSDRRLAAA